MATENETRVEQTPATIAEQLQPGRKSMARLVTNYTKAILAAAVKDDGSAAVRGEEKGDAAHPGK
ncbi:MAG TPA: hypothetical protein VKA46_20785 [Gemmataceae bacterium]|nr:hypothetical protein [Gemmataceae bacterium]